MTIADDLSSQLITGAWTDILLEFVAGSTHELLVVSPWMKLGAARLMAEALSGPHHITLNIISRLDEDDFLSGMSDINAFRQETYPSNTHLQVRAVKLLHAKMLICDRREVLIGSANLTEGGLYKNHEAVAWIKSTSFAEKCASFHFDLWKKATAVDDEFLRLIDDRIDASLPSPAAEEDEDKRSQRKNRAAPEGSKTRASRTRYVQTRGYRAAREQISGVLQRSVNPYPQSTEETRSALDWLLRGLHFIPDKKDRADALDRLERLFYHPDTNVRAAAIDRSGRLGNRVFLLRFQALLSNPHEKVQVRSAAAFALSLLGAPEGFAALQAMTDSKDDVGRWARRGCFLLLNLVGPDERQWFLENVGVKDPKEATDLVRELAPEQGTVSVRLTKALIAEKLTMGEWSNLDLDLLALMMFHLGRRLSKKKKFEKYVKVQIIAADHLHVRRGDLRHGPFSPALLKKAWERDWEDPSLSRIFSLRWKEIAKDINMAECQFRSPQLLELWQIFSDEAKHMMYDAGEKF